MICNMCGASCPEGTRFCPSCGADLAEQPQNQQAQYQQPQYQQPQYQQPQYQQPQYQQPQYQQPPYQNPYQNPYQQPQLPGKGLGVASLVLGILSFFCFAIILGSLAIAFGAISKKKAAEVGAKNGMANAGMILGIISLVLWVLMMIFAPELAFGSY